MNPGGRRRQRRRGGGWRDRDKGFGNWAPPTKGGVGTRWTQSEWEPVHGSWQPPLFGRNRALSIARCLPQREITRWLGRSAIPKSALGRDRTQLGEVCILIAWLLFSYTLPARFKKKTLHSIEAYLPLLLATTCPLGSPSICPKPEAGLGGALVGGSRPLPIHRHLGCHRVKR